MEFESGEEQEGGGSLRSRQAVPELVTESESRRTAMRRREEEEEEEEKYLRQFPESHMRPGVVVFLR